MLVFKRLIVWWGAGVVICLERCADLHMAQLMPLPLTDSCFSKIQIGFYLSDVEFVSRCGQHAWNYNLYRHDGWAGLGWIDGQKSPVFRRGKSRA